MLKIRRCSFPKYSDTQYILLLSQCTKDEAMGIVNRVLESFYESYKFFWKINVKIELDEINMDFKRDVMKKIYDGIITAAACHYDNAYCGYVRPKNI